LGQANSAMRWSHSFRKWRWEEEHKFFEAWCRDVLLRTRRSLAFLRTKSGRGSRPCTIDQRRDIGAGSSATRAWRRIAAVSARICSLRVRIAVGAGQLKERRARVAVRLCGFGGTPLPGNDLQLRLKLTT
jgi:hypothetical protein